MCRISTVLRQPVALQKHKAKNLNIFFLPPRLCELLALRCYYELLRGIFETFFGTSNLLVSKNRLKNVY